MNLNHKGDGFDLYKGGVSPVIRRDQLVQLMVNNKMKKQSSQRDFYDNLNESPIKSMAT